MRNAHYIWQLPNWTDRLSWDSSRMLSRIGKTRLRQGTLLGKAASLGLDVGCDVRVSLLSRVRVDILTDEAIATSAIESERLDRQSVQAAVERHLGIPSVGTQPAERHVDGLVEMLIDATTAYSAPLSAERLQGWQAALFPSGFSGVKRIAVGNWRRHRNPAVVVADSAGGAEVCYKAPPASEVAAEMERFLTWWKGNGVEFDGLIRAGLAHFWFSSVHPFDDGSGRVARALTDMALAQDEASSIRLYGMSDQILDQRDAYCHALEEAQRGEGDLTDWLCWFLDCLERSMARAEVRLERTLARSRFWQRHGGSALNERQLLVLNVLLDAGPGGFPGGLCTRKYVCLTDTSRATAQREIANMINQGLLVQRPGGGRSTSYDAAWD